MKQETNYFKHASNSRNSEELLEVMDRHGLVGYAVYFMLLERLRDAPDFCQKRRSYNIVGKDFGCSAAVVKSVVEDFGLFAFTEDGERFYSEELCEQMNDRAELIEQRRQAGKKSAQARYRKDTTEKTEKTEKTEIEQPLNDRSNLVEHQSVNQSSQSNQSVNQSKPSKRFAPPRATQEEVLKRLNYFAQLKDGKERNALDMILVMGGEIPVPDPSEQMAIVNLDGGGLIGGIFWTAVREWRTKPDLRKAIDHPNYWLLAKYKHLDSYKKLFGIQKEETDEGVSK